MKSHYERLEKKLSFKPENAWKTYNATEVMKFAENYKKFLNKSKIERFAFEEIKKQAKGSGFKKYSEGDALTPGKKYFFEGKNKIIALAVLGKEPMIEGCNILVSHIDSPRLDLKQTPLYEDSELALFKTHYYGGIKKWQWVNVPLAFHGLVSTKNGDLQLIIGEDKNDPVFTVADLLPHLAKKQNEKDGKKLISGEELNVVVGSMPVKDKKIKKKIKLAVLEHLHKEYGLTEEDLITAELAGVPAGEPRDVGFDRSMVGGYGQDDKSCTYALLESFLQLKKPDRTSIAYFMDKEEIGSDGPTGSQSFFFENVVKKISADPMEVLSNSRGISADVDAGVNPTYKDVYDLKNANYVGKGLAITKYTGGGGKYSTNDASAEYIRFIVNLCNKEKIPWQVGELGKVDEGGGGTIAMHLSKYGCDTIDVGIPLLSMHSPFEISSKVDLYSLFKFYSAFLDTN